METTGDRVRKEREVKRPIWSQQRLADEVTKLGHKITQDGIAKIESRGSRRPRCARELAVALGLTLEWLLTGKGQKYSNADEEFPWREWWGCTQEFREGLIELIKTQAIQAEPVDKARASQSREPKGKGL